MIDKYIRNLIDQGENQHLDFKFEVTDAKKLARTFSAFANTQGGKLLIGVKDNGVIAGVRTEEEVYMLESAAHVFCKPKVEYEIRSWQLEGKTILEVDIAESPNKPHLAPWKEESWKPFIRQEDENFVANSVQVSVWKNQYSSKPTLVKFNRQEKELLSFLAEKSEISLRGFCRLCQIKYPLAKKILVNLISIGVLKIGYTGESVLYRINDGFTDPVESD